eukprot:gb/GECH01003423.1/.p1 GENE.gb/GECH01003423.1/~~gb/GECH01003423.1/.p1  ORF type:complete len:323 (+),score=27.79 gb/GECH01003423.1/:1-969(+)
MGEYLYRRDCEFLKENMGDYTTSELCQMFGACPSEDSQIDDESKCHLCEYFAGATETWINTTSEDEIEQHLHNICRAMPGSLEPTCNDLVDSHGPTIISRVKTHANDDSPSEVCRDIDLCSLPRSDSMSSSEDDHHSSSEISSGSSHSYQSSSSHSISVSSSDVSSSSVSSSSSAQHSSSSSSIELGSSSEMGSNSSSADDDSSSINDVECTLCEYILRESQQFENRTSDNNIVQLLRSLCTPWPDEEEKTCESIVGTYTPDIIQYINTDSRDISDFEFCQQIELCPQDSSGPGILSFAIHSTPNLFLSVGIIVFAFLLLCL